MNEPLLSFQNVTCSPQGVPRLHQVSFNLPERACWSIVGPNGAGKSTLLKCLIRQLPIHAGQIVLKGLPLHAWSQKELARVVAYVPQQVSPGYFHDTVEAIVESGRYPHRSLWGGSREQDKHAVEEAILLLGLQAFRHRPMAHLSGGEQQKVWLAAAVAQSPELLLLDEPASNLDYRHQDEIHHLLARLNQERGMTILAVTHNLNDALASSDTVLALKEGQPVFCGSPQSLLANNALQKLFNTAFLHLAHPETGLPMILRDRLPKVEIDEEDTP